jgi:Lon protease-like protein
MSEKLPLFPLNTVLFPGMTLDLHIFEARYRVMINRCIQTGRPFGVVLIKTGHAVGGGETNYKIGTRAHIANVIRHIDGRLDIQVVGTERFHIKGYEQAAPFKIALAENFALNNASSGHARELAGQIKLALHAYLANLLNNSELSIEMQGIQIPSEPVALGYFFGAVMPIPEEDKQRLLEARSAEAILLMVSDILRRETALLPHLSQKPASDDETVFSLN